MYSIEALYDAVCAAPDDDAPRVAYAKAIAKLDQDRAEYIDLELKLAKWRTQGGVTPDERTKASTRARMLLDRNKRTWDATVRAVVGGESGFYRGFPELVELDAAKFLTVAPELYRRAPIRHLDLTGVKPVAAELFASPHLARIVSLSLLRNELGDAEIAVLAKSPYLGRLEWLDLGINSIGEAGIDALAASTRLGKLGYVSLMTNPVADPTPKHCDGYEQTSPVAAALQAKYGPRPWLDAHERTSWPPDRDAVKY